MSRPRRALIAGAVVVVVAIAYGLFWWIDPFRGAWVPSCTEIAPRLQAELGGGWRVTDPDEHRERSRHRSSTMCEISFFTADQKHTGTIFMFVVREPDEEKARKEVRSYRCGEPDVDMPSPQDYVAFRLCAKTYSMQTVASVYAAKSDRRVSASVRVNVRDDAHAATAYARDLSRLTAEKALTTAEPD